ncbi:lipid phosphate phosphatase 1 [Collybia nuda]|uniref:Lipid phosphate phosphatase 1 n=1 Tax=Collybia nuda TaxID=64659 RepID=A0A9P6CHE2_9AGAR|nr:lipid phosphate phosphatase 1 [Collybia nuda]
MRKTVQRYFGDHALDWADRSYLIDWIVIVLIWMLAWITSLSPVFERTFDLKDPIIDYPHGKDQISSTLNHNIAFWFPILILVLVGGIRRSLIEIHHGLIALCAGRGLARLVTVLMKHRVGRLRPDFLARCKWDKVLNACTGDPKLILDGRKSFPSGHSSTAFSGMTFLALWLAGNTAAWCFDQTKPAGSVRSSRLGCLFLTLLPLSWAAFVAISRMEDYKHHKEDIIVGSVIGIISATISYLLFWPNPCSTRSFAPDRERIPRQPYANEEYRIPDVEFRLTRLEEEDIEHI